MAIAHARKIVIGDKTYHWRVDGPKDNYGKGWTPGSLRLIVRGPDFNTAFTVRSKHWTDDHELAWAGETYVSPPAHKVAFGPKLVRLIIEGGRDFPDWRVTPMAGPVS